MQPIYHKSSYKLNAREQNAIAYERLTKVHSIPKDRQYWTLCNSQPLDAGSEIVQMVNLGACKKEQFHGVDRDEAIIEQNKIWHPTANWHFGDWIEVIEGYEDFNPALVYLDSTSFADHRVALNLTVRTMFLCPRGTVLIVNAMLNDPRSSKQFDPDKLVYDLRSEVPSMELNKWDTTVSNFQYSATGRTYMISYVFYKKEN
jgi:hypothetical protein